VEVLSILINFQYFILMKAESNDKKYIEHAVASSLTGLYIFAKTGDFAGWGQTEEPCISILPNGSYV